MVLVHAWSQTLWCYWYSFLPGRGHKAGTGCMHISGPEEDSSGQTPRPGPHPHDLPYSAPTPSFKDVLYLDLSERKVKETWLQGEQTGGRGTHSLLPGGPGILRVYVPRCL